MFSSAIPPTHRRASLTHHVSTWGSPRLRRPHHCRAVPLLALIYALLHCTFLRQGRDSLPPRFVPRLCTFQFPGLEGDRPHSFLPSLNTTYISPLISSSLPSPTLSSPLFTHNISTLYTTPPKHNPRTCQSALPLQPIVNMGKVNIPSLRPFGCGSFTSWPATR